MQVPVLVLLMLALSTSLPLLRLPAALSTRLHGRTFEVLIRHRGDTCQHFAVS